MSMAPQRLLALLYSVFTLHSYGSQQEPLTGMGTADTRGVTSRCPDYACLRSGRGSPWERKTTDAARHSTTMIIQCDETPQGKFGDFLELLS